MKYIFLIQALVFIGCHRHKSYAFTSKTELNPVKLTEQPARVLEYQELLKSYTYQLPEHICKSSKSDSISAYVDLVYQNTQKKKYHRYANEKEIIQEGDSIVHFKFRYPKIIHGHISYTYNKRNCNIHYVRINNGKF